ncbi:MAG: hypothetical protein SX243_04800 [Acidobacteriota bacterium]|nr:hypothetical protein [Acidobacteriota bacterium]
MATSSTATAAYAADPFYERLLRDGIEAAARGEHAEAQKDLNLACFGFLDDLELLSECLVQLGLSQAQTGDSEGFRDTFRRVLEIEERFGAYTEAQLPLDLRSRFEAESVERVPEALLRRVDAFAKLADRKRLGQIENLSPDEQRAFLEERITEEPEDFQWRLELAQLELDQDRPQQALDALHELSQDAARVPQARCLSAEAAIRLGRCTAAEQLATCPRPRRNTEAAAALLECLAERGRWTEAQAFLSAAGSTALGRRDLQRWNRRVERALRDSNGQNTPEAAAADRSPLPEVEAAPATRLSAEEQAELQRARDLLANAEMAQDLDEAFAIAAEVADANPQAREAQHLAAEIAYRASRWTEAAAYFRRGGDPGDDNPIRLFFMAVSFYESGDRESAAAALRRSLPGIQRTPYVERYVQNILGTEAVNE